MSNKSIISTKRAPKAIGTYSQAVKVGNTIYLSGQIPLDPIKMTLVGNDISDQVNQVFRNLQAVCLAAGGSLQNIVKLTIFLTDLSCFSVVNEIMSEWFDKPYPARAAVGIAELPKGAQVEIDAIMILNNYP